jgi:hypothetical protein
MDKNLKEAIELVKKEFGIAPSEKISILRCGGLFGEFMEGKQFSDTVAGSNVKYQLEEAVNLINENTLHVLSIQLDSKPTLDDSTIHFRTQTEPAFPFLGITVCITQGHPVELVIVAFKDPALRDEFEFQSVEDLEYGGLWRENV